MKIFENRTMFKSRAKKWPSATTHKILYKTFTRKITQHQHQKTTQRGVDWKVLKRQLRQEAIAQKNAHARTSVKL